MHALVFDLDGTLVGFRLRSRARLAARAQRSGCSFINGHRLHRHVGSSGDLIVRHAHREAGRKLSAAQVETVHRRHAELFRQILPRPRPSPGAVEVFRALRESSIPYAIAIASCRPLIDASQCSSAITERSPLDRFADGRAIHEQSDKTDERDRLKAGKRIDGFVIRILKEHSQGKGSVKDRRGCDEPERELYGSPSVMPTTTFPH